MARLPLLVDLTLAAAELVIATIAVAACVLAGPPWVYIPPVVALVALVALVVDALTTG